MSKHFEVLIQMETVTDGESNSCCVVLSFIPALLQVVSNGLQHTPRLSCCDSDELKTLPHLRDMQRHERMKVTGQKKSDVEEREREELLLVRSFSSDINALEHIKT
ncbi:hypothetical protein IRJ41_013460 [Triplophysa rosa]|uniref:Uncharacterized protein n=1 Tax=Triplophysa rosa TaxID=992332 RepID=A0A9W7TMF2_TRIRA|nr:hypothetical protein IRJ41_013460 [Triplophysa rosa]